MSLTSPPSPEIADHALRRAIFWRETAKDSRLRTLSGVKLCRENMHRMALVWKRERPKREVIVVHSSNPSQWSAGSFRQVIGRINRRPRHIP